MTEKHTPDWTPELWSDSTHARTWKETGGAITSILRTMPDADYDRARLCTNALSGIPDPAAFVAAARRVAEWAEPPAQDGDMPALRLAIADLHAAMETP